MEHQHLDAADLEHLLATDRTAKQNEQLFHLLAVCSRCREAGGWLLELHQANALPPIFGLIDAILARSLRRSPEMTHFCSPKVTQGEACGRPDPACCDTLLSQSSAIGVGDTIGPGQGSE